MKKIIITILALVVLSLSLMADDAVFKEKDNEKSPNLYGYIYEWDGAHYSATSNIYQISASWWENIDWYNDPNSAHVTSYTQNNSNGYYEITFPYPTCLATWGYVIITVNGNEYVVENYDGHTQVDIYLPRGNCPLPTPDNTIQEND